MYYVNNKAFKDLKSAITYQNSLMLINQENLALSLQGKFKQIDTTIKKR